MLLPLLRRRVLTFTNTIGHWTGYDGDRIAALRAERVVA